MRPNVRVALFEPLQYAAYFSTGYYDSSLFKYKRNFLQATIDTLLLVTGLPRIRIQNVDLHMDTDDIYFTGSLMETPPPLCKWRCLTTQWAHDIYTVPSQRRCNTMMLNRHSGHVVNSPCARLAG